MDKLGLVAEVLKLRSFGPAEKAPGLRMTVCDYFHGWPV
jgi:hypothetical protein